MSYDDPGILQTPETVFKVKHCVWDPIAELTVTHHGQLHSQQSTPTTKGQGWSGEDLSYWLSTCVSVY